MKINIPIILIFTFSFVMGLLFYFKSYPSAVFLTFIFFGMAFHFLFSLLFDLVKK
jgi:hypothetical protein